MSTLGKLFIGLTILFSAGAAVVGFLVVQQKSQYAGQLASVESALKATPNTTYNTSFKDNTSEPAATLKKASEGYKTALTDLSTTQDSLKTAQDDLTKSKTEVANLTTEVASAKKQAEETASKLAVAEATVKEKEGELQKYSDALKGRVIDQVIADLDEFREKTKVLEAEKKIIEDSLAQMQAKVKQYEIQDNLRNEGRAPLDLSGKVLAINREWNFVVLDVGKANQLVEGVDLSVYRGNTLIGKVRTVSVEANTAVADILPDWTKTEIQVGDKVLF
jgi:chromosome segregation ATPase